MTTKQYQCPEKASKPKQRVRLSNVWFGVYLKVIKHMSNNGRLANQLWAMELSCRKYQACRNVKTNQYEMFTFLTFLSFHFMPSTPSGCASGHDAEFKTRLRSFLWFYLESFTKHKGTNLGKFTISASSTIHTIGFKCHIILYKLRM